MSDDFCAVIAPNKLFPVSQFDFLALQKMTLVIFLAVTWNTLSKVQKQKEATTTTARFKKNKQASKQGYHDNMLKTSVLETS